MKSQKTKSIRSTLPNISIITFKEIQIHFPPIPFIFILLHHSISHFYTYLIKLLHQKIFMKAISRALLVVIFTPVALPTPLHVMPFGAKLINIWKNQIT